MRVDPNYVNTLAAAVGQSSNAENKLTSELSSGLRVSELQDDPVAAAESARFASAIAKGDTYVQTASSETAKMQVADTTLGEVVTQLTTALSLAVKGNDGTLNAANRASVAQQLTGIRDQVLSLANASYQGEYLFGGSQGATQPFTLDTSTTPATATYNGDTKLQSIETPSGQTIQTNVPGSDLFGGATGAFAALNQLIADVSGSASSATLTADTDALKGALSQVSSQRSVLDTSLSMVQTTSTYFQTQVVQLTAQQSNLVAADPASVASQLSSAETQHQALLSVMSAVGKTDLFDYLH
ncbi:flagellar hook-associated protein FlgL [Edaphobacter sp.]|uniref:flagellar hook-associated protein FlgL n=1 Tax=Edaphobacter sp. TaxID=1934404 RepID=UPI002DB97873|nr:flagellar hook-associated protein FlgL [Edaphobacter sp.]HEU5341407.1 flagellar hook-associated protein FlgL [Edaphobacter sp.]